MSEEGLRIAARMAGRLVAGSAGASVVRLMQEPHGWDPVVPADMHSSKLPPVDADGCAECIQCKTRHLFNELTIANEMYFCRGCTAVNTRRQALEQAQGIDVDNVKIGRSWTGTLVGLGVAFTALGICVAIYLS